MPKIPKTNTVVEPEVVVSRAQSLTEQLRLKSPWLLVGVVMLGMVVWGYYQYRQNKQLSSQLRQAQNQSTQVKNNDAEIQQLVETVGKLLVLPTGEQPTVATVTDPGKLASQPFFANAKTGDKVLIYSTAKKAVLFRPSENKIVEVGPVSVGSDASKDLAPESGLTKKAK
jgi:hypothetical protein